MRRLFALFLVFGLTGCFGKTVITKSEYEKLATGASYQEAVQIIGQSGTESSRVEIEGAPVTVSYTWQNPNGSNAIMTFQDGKLVTKAQAGLK